MRSRREFFGAAAAVPAAAVVLPVDNAALLDVPLSELRGWLFDHEHRGMTLREALAGWRRNEN